MKDLFTIKIKDKEYVHIDTIKYKNQIIYHFGSLEDELFCLKEGKDYNPIQDAFQLAIIKNKLGLINQRYIFDVKQDVYGMIEGLGAEIDYYMRILDRKIKYGRSDIKIVEENEKYKIVQEQIGNFSEIKEKFNINLKLEEIVQKIRNVKLIKNDVLLKGSASGYYAPPFNVVALEDKNDIEKENNWYKRVRLHEYIHSITGKKCIEYGIFGMNGLLEGETENLVENYMGSEESFFYYDEKNKNKASIQFNFSRNTSYAPLVSIVRQMEYAIGKKSHNSILNGNMEFEQEFAQKYGMPLMIFLIHRTRMLLSGRNLNERLKNIKPFDEIKYFKNTQDILMKKVFDKDFESIGTIDDAKVYLQKLRDFETIRGRIRHEGKTAEEQIEDTSFKDYYEKKHLEIKELLQSKGLDKTEIDTSLEQYKYKRQFFKSFRTQDEECNMLKKIIIEDIAEDCIRNESANISINNFEFNYFRIIEDTYHIFVNDKSKNKVISFGLTHDEEEENANELLKQIKSKEEESTEELEQDLKKAGFKEEKIEFSEEEFKERLFSEFRRIDDSLYKDLFYTAMYEEQSEEKKEKIKKMQKRSIAVKNILKMECESERKEEVDNTKVDKAKELINLSKEQDKEIQQLESQLVEKGISRNE